MIEAAFLVLRECAELMLIAWTVRACLIRVQRRELVRHLHIGLAVGALLGALMVHLLTTRNWSARADAVLSIALGLAVLSMASAMLSSRLAIDSHVGKWLQDAIDAPSGYAFVALFSALAALRETVETGIFLHAVTAEHGWRDAVGGAVLGLVAALMVALAFRTLQARVPLLAIFRLSSLLLCLIAIQLTLEGLGGLLATWPRLEGLGLVDVLTPGHSAYGYLCALLMLGPVTVVIRRWWGESATPQ